MVALQDREWLVAAREGLQPIFHDLVDLRAMGQPAGQRIVTLIMPEFRLADNSGEQFPLVVQKRDRDIRFDRSTLRPNALLRRKGQEPAACARIG
jgi:hypothetical protein